MSQQHLAKAAQLAPIVERVHAQNHPEFSRVRELTEALHQADSATDTSELFAQLRETTDNYTTPSDACEAYEEVYAQLELADAAQNGVHSD